MRISVDKRPIVSSPIVKGIKGLTHDLRWTDGVAGNCERHAKYEI